MTTPSPATPAFSAIHPATRLGHVHYTVADLERQITFYRNVLGFKVHWRAAEAAGLGAGGEDLLRLTVLPGARRARGVTGLYHTAFLVPTRWELAQLLRRIAVTRTPIQGMTDHGTHYAIYLPDAEGNGVELAWDFPPDQWPQTIDEMLRRNRGLAPETIFQTLTDQDACWEGLSPGARVGHVHLHVSHLDNTHDFYHRVLGFTVPLGFDRFSNPFTETARFFAAGGYHHHIGANIWQGEGAPPPPPDAAGLRYFTIVLPDEVELERVLERMRGAGVATDATAEGWLIRDPSANGILLTTELAG